MAVAGQPLHPDPTCTTTLYPPPTSLQPTLLDFLDTPKPENEETFWGDNIHTDPADLHQVYFQNVDGIRNDANEIDLYVKTMHQFNAGTIYWADPSGETMDRANSAFDAIEIAAQKAEARLDDIAGLTEPVRDNRPQMAEHVLSITRNLDGIISDIQVFSEAMHSQKGMLSYLVHDDELFHRIDIIVTNAEEISHRIRPILEDVRIFTDKIARDPRQLGMKGALDQRPSGLKTGVL